MTTDRTPEPYDIGEGLLFEYPNDFYMVWTKTGHVPRFTHSSFKAASDEASRLARQTPGRKFIVLKAVAKFHLPPAVATVAADNQT